MAKKVSNSKGFLIIQMSVTEAQLLGFGFNGACVCMSCNDLCLPDVYYIAALNDCMCEKCMEKFLSDATRYEEDIPYEEKYYNQYTKILGL